MTTKAEAQLQVRQCFAPGCPGMVKFYMEWGRDYEWVAECGVCHRTYRLQPTRDEVEECRQEQEKGEPARWLAPTSFPCPMPECGGTMRYERSELLYESPRVECPTEYFSYECDGPCGLTLHLERFNSAAPSREKP